jgi:hypothetical protein
VARLNRVIFFVNQHILYFVKAVNKNRRGGKMFEKKDEKDKRFSWSGSEGVRLLLN